MTLGDTVLYYTSDTELIRKWLILKRIFCLSFGSDLYNEQRGRCCKGCVDHKCKNCGADTLRKYEGSEEDAQKLKRLLSGKADVVFFIDETPRIFRKRVEKNRDYCRSGKAGEDAELYGSGASEKSGHESDCDYR